MAKEDDEWLPLRQAVTEVSDAYALAIGCERRDAIEIALEAVLRRAQYMIANTRAPKWILKWPPDDGFAGERESNIDGAEIPPLFWSMHGQARDLIADDWIAGEFSFSFSLDFYDSEDEAKNALAETIEPSKLGFGMALGVEITRRGLPVVGDIGSDYAGVNPGKFSRREFEERRGRPKFWDWEGAICSVLAHTDKAPDPLPSGYGAQAQIGRLLSEWFLNNQGGEPAPSAISERASKILRAIEHHQK